MDSRKNEIDFLEKEIDVLWEERESLLNIQSHDFEKIASLSFDLRQKNKSRMRLFIEESEIKKILDGVPLSESSVMNWIEEYLNEQYNELLKGWLLWNLLKSYLL